MAGLLQPVQYRPSALHSQDIYPDLLYTPIIYLMQSHGITIQQGEGGVVWRFLLTLRAGWVPCATGDTNDPPEREPSRTPCHVATSRAASGSPVRLGLALVDRRAKARWTLSRERFIDPRIWASEQFCRLSEPAAMMFIGIITTADDHGRRRGSSHSLKLDIFPTRPHTVDDVGRMRDELVRSGLVQHYRDEDGNDVVSIPSKSWKRYQHPRWIAQSRLPEFPGTGEVTLPPVVTRQGHTASAQTCTEPVQVCTGPVQPSCNPAEGRGVDWSGVVGGGQNPPSPPSPLPLDVSVRPNAPNAPKRQKARTATAGIAHVAPTTATAERTNDAPDLTPTLEPARSMLEAMLADGQFRKAAELRSLVNLADHRDPLNLLAHVRDCATHEEASSAAAMLWQRLSGAGIVPSEAAIAWAREQLSHDDGPRGGCSSPTAALQAAIEARRVGIEPQYQEAFDGLTTGWSYPGETNHDAQKRSAALLLAANPRKALAYTAQVNATEIPRGHDPWEVLAELCVRLPTPRAEDVAAVDRILALRMSQDSDGVGR